ncbi:hypothetical protein VTK56DRAFT_5066 [Thermocarpiscus australiensis]
MGVQLEAINQTSFEQYGPWHFRDARFTPDKRIDLGASALQTAGIPALNDRFREISRARRADCDIPGSSAEVAPFSILEPPEGPTGQGSSTTVSTSTVPAPVSTSNTICHSLFPFTPHPALVFNNQLVPSGKEVVAFPLREPCVERRPCLKRRRPDTDIDGPNTASLGCKKRRLLRQLVTSRLSQPFSLPATHILNREAVATGDRRFLKLAAIMAARRLNSTVATQTHALPPPQPSPSTWLRRAAVLNSLRQRACAEAAERGNARVANVIAAKAAVLQQGQGTTGPFVGGRYIVVTPSPPSGMLTLGPHGPPQHACPQKSGSGTRSPPPGGRPGPQAVTPVTSPPRLRIPSPRLRPLRSPELRVTRPAVALDDLEDLDDDGVAFPTSEHESRYEDEPEDVYADFGAIFGGGEGAVSEEDVPGEHFEDYMDELDGIPWNARC